MQISEQREGQHLKNSFCKGRTNKFSSGLYTTALAEMPSVVSKELISGSKLFHILMNFPEKIRPDT